MQEMFNKDLEEIKESQSIMNNAIKDISTEFIRAIHRVATEVVVALPPEPPSSPSPSRLYRALG